MTKRTFVAAVFLVGCAVGGVSGQLLDVPRASAQQAATLTKWEYLCPDEVEFKGWEAYTNRAGSQGWELVTSHLDRGNYYACFKRPKL